MSKLVRYEREITGAVGVAEDVGYNNVSSGLEASNVQEAIDELDSDLTDIGNRVTLGYVENISSGKTVTLSDALSNYRTIAFDFISRSTHSICEINSNLLLGLITNNGSIRFPVVINSNYWGMWNINGTNSTDSLLDVACGVSGNTDGNLYIYGIK